MKPGCPYIPGPPLAQSKAHHTFRRLLGRSTACGRFCFLLAVNIEGIHPSSRVLHITAGPGHDMNMRVLQNSLLECFVRLSSDGAGVVANSV